MGKISQTCDLIRVFLHLEGTAKYHILTLNSQCVLLVLIGTNSRYMHQLHAISLAETQTLPRKAQFDSVFASIMRNGSPWNSDITQKNLSWLRFYSDNLSKILLAVCAYSYLGHVTSAFWVGWSFWDRTRKAKWNCTGEDVDEVEVVRSEELGHWSKANSLIN